MSCPPGCPGVLRSAPEGVYTEDPTCGDDEETVGPSIEELDEGISDADAQRADLELLAQMDRDDISVIVTDEDEE
jgi:hypothetical protein